MTNRESGYSSQSSCPWNGDKFVRLTKEPGYLPRAPKTLERPGPGPGSGPKQPGSGAAAAPLGSGSGRPDSDPACADLRSAPATSGGLAPGSGAAASPLDSDSDSGRAPSSSGAGAAIPGTSGPALLDLIAMDETAWDEFSRGSAIRRAHRAGFLRNVAVALGNWGAPEAVAALVRALSDSEALVRGHAAWALGRIGTAEARAELETRCAVEEDVYVRDEIVAAMAAGHEVGAPHPPDHRLNAGYGA